MTLAQSNPTSGSGSAPGTVARATGSLAMLAFLIIGVPWILVTLAGWPLPTRWPDWGDVWLDLRQLNLDRRLIVGVLATSAWLAWSQIIWSLAFEVRNMVRVGRGLTARTAPFTVAAVSAVVSKLVAGVVSLTLLTSSSASAGVLSPGQPTTMTLDDQPDVEPETSTTSAFDQRTTPGSTGQRRHVTKIVVGPSETAWDVAVRVFGDGHRVEELLAHNGVSALDVGPGTLLELPPGVDPPTPLDRAMVVDGDHFWVLAGDKLAESWGREPTDEELTSYWSDMVALNEDRLLPPGDPDLIYPGQELLFPPVPPVAGVDADPAASPTVLGGESTATAGATRTPASTPTTDSMATPASTPTIESTATTLAASATESTSTAIDAGKPADSTDTDSTDEPGEVPFGLVAVSGIGLITAAIGGIVARNQARRIGGRRPGTTPRFAVPGSAERLITETSDDDALTDLDRALRHLGMTLNAEGLALPDLVGVLVGADDIRLLVATPHNAAPDPFTAERGGMVWATARPVPDVDVRQALNPYPTLISIGFTETARLLIDLEYIGSVNLTGGFADVVDAMGTMALQLATSPLADTIEVVCVGFGEELAELERLTVVSSVDSIRSGLAAHADAVSTLVDVTDNSAPGGRAAGVGDWTPMVVFDPLSRFDGESSDLLTSVGRTPGAGVSAVVNSVDPIHSTALTMELTEDRVSIPAYDVTLDRRPLTRAERTDLSSAVAAAKDPELAERSDLLSTFGSSSPESSSGPPPGEPSDVEPASHVVRLLGPLRVEDNAGQVAQFARSATPEFLAYLIHHRTGVDVGQVMNSLWPSTTARRTWIANVYADAARVLGGAEPGVGNGVTMTPRPDADDQYRMADRVTSDVEQFRALLKSAISRPVDEAVELLTDALAMVEGVPYSNITSRWPITEGCWQEATVMVDEAARCVAVLALDQFDDPTLAEWATARGLLASPHSVELHRLRLRAALALDGQPERAGLSPDAVFQHYQAVVMADDHRPEATSRLDPELVELYESYRRSQPTTVRSTDFDTLERQR